MLRQAIEEIIAYKKIPRPGEEQTTGTIQLAGANEIMDDYTGMQISEVTRILSKMGLDYNIVGNGVTVARHVPMAGRLMPLNSPVYIYMDGDISNPEGLASVPHVVELSEDQARRSLENAGFIPVVSMISPIGGSIANDGAEPVTGAGTPIPSSPDIPLMTVTWQYPAPDGMIQKGSTVRLRVRP
jgi:beta-lactam-binding protein with PASTA domain